MSLISSERKFWSVSPRLYFRNVTSWTLWNVTDLAFLFWLTSPKDALEGLRVAAYELNRQAKLLKVTCVCGSLRLCLHSRTTFFSLLFDVCPRVICDGDGQIYLTRTHLPLKWSIVGDQSTMSHEVLKQLILCSSYHNLLSFCMLLILDTDLLKLIHMSDKSKKKKKGFLNAHWDGKNWAVLYIHSQ